MTYWQWLLIFFGLPLLGLFLLDSHIFTSHKKIFILVWAGSLLIFYPWDLIALSIGYWRFPHGLVAVQIAGLPIEEYVWAILVSSIVTFVTLYLLKHQNAAKQLR